MEADTVVHLSRGTFWTAIGIAMAACAVPSSQLALAQAGTAELITACQECPSERELRRAVQDDAQLEFVQRVNAIEQRMTGRPLSGGNEVHLLLDGPQTHGAQLQAIARARHHVHLITYIMTDDKLAHDYLRVLGERARRGVKVRLMFDSVGGRTVSDEFLGALQKARIEVRAFGPMNPMKGEEWTTTRRHHRKLVVVDGKVAFTGGINISDEYRKSSADTRDDDKNAKEMKKKRKDDEERKQNGKDETAATGPGWRDTSIRVEGPAVAQFQQMFFDSWQEDYQQIPPDDRYWPKLRRKGDSFVRVVQQQGTDLPGVAAEPVKKAVEDEDVRDRPIYGSYVAAISAAKKRVWITQAYFIPNDEFIGVIQNAARRGVDVRVLVPHTSDIDMMVQASRFHYQPLLEAGARIFEYSGPMLHAKTAVVDGVWATVGSSNLDQRSFVHNDEANATVIGHEFAAEMEAMFQKDTARAKEITREQWAKRSWRDRWRQRMAVMLEYWI